MADASGSMYYMLDGAYNLDNYFLAAAPFPNPEATQEFTVISNNFDPRYGFTAGGVVSIVTKSGTNDWHGDAFDFFRNGGFNAKDYFTHTTNKIHRNQFGGSLGGPIVKDKFFIFGNYQGTRQSMSTTTGTGFIPTSAMVNNGDFLGVCVLGFVSGICQDQHMGPDPNGSSLPQIPYVDHQIYGANILGYSNGGVPLRDLTTAGAYTGAPNSPYGAYYPGNQINPATFSPGAVNLVNVLDSGLTPVNAFGSLLGTSVFQHQQLQRRDGARRLQPERQEPDQRPHVHQLLQPAAGRRPKRRPIQPVLDQPLAELCRHLDLDDQSAHRE